MTTTTKTVVVEPRLLWLLCDWHFACEYKLHQKVPPLYEH